MITDEDGLIEVTNFTKVLDKEILTKGKKVLYDRELHDGIMRKKPKPSDLKTQICGRTDFRHNQKSLRNGKNALHKQRPSPRKGIMSEKKRLLNFRKITKEERQRLNPQERRAIKSQRKQKIRQYRQELKILQKQRNKFLRNYVELINNSLSSSTVTKFSDFMKSRVKIRKIEIIMGFYISCRLTPSISKTKSAP